MDPFEIDGNLYDIDYDVIPGISEEIKLHQGTISFFNSDNSDNKMFVLILKIN